MMKRILILVLMSMGIVSTNVIAQSCSELSEELDGTVVFKLQPGSDPVDVIAAMILVNPQVSYELIDQIPNRDIYLVEYIPILIRSISMVTNISNFSFVPKNGLNWFKIVKILKMVQIGPN